MPEWKDPEIVAMRAALAGLTPPADAPTPTWEQRRMGIDAMGQAMPPPAGVTIEPTTLGGVAGLKHSVAGATRTILYLHGGGYCIGGSASHRTLVARLALAGDANAWALDYRLAPEHPFPDAVDDALAAYRALLDAGTDPARLVVAGDSAGGGLTLATWLAAKAAGLPSPAALHVMSPWANLAQTGPAYAAKAQTDPIITKAALDDFAGAYLAGKTDPATALASPVLGDFAGVPPLLIQVGAEEVLLSDALAVAEKAGLAGGDVTLRIWPEMIHIWPFFALSAGGRAIDEAAAWLKARIP